MRKFIFGTIFIFTLMCGFSSCGQCGSEPHYNDSIDTCVVDSTVIDTLALDSIIQDSIAE